MWDDAKLLNFAAGLLTALSIVAIGASLIAWLARHPVFAIRQVQFSGTLNHVDPAHLRAVVADELRGTFFTLKLDAARLAFLGVTWVREAAVRRRWPDRLEVRLDEHWPLARWNGSTLVGSDGQVFAAEYDRELPALAGPEGTAREVTDAYHRYRKALAALARSISELRLSERRAWTLRLDNGIEVQLGRDRPDERMQRFVTWYPKALAPLVGDERALVQHVDMRYRSGFAARVPGFREPEPKNESHTDRGPALRRSR